MKEKEAGLLDINVGKMFAQPQYQIRYALDLYSDSQTVNQTTVFLPPGKPTRGVVINAIIVEEYPNDKMQAVQNNYLLDPENEEAKTEMARMQECRRQAKMIADEVMRIINEEIIKDE